jgi:hypothetical protein
MSANAIEYRFKTLSAHGTVVLRDCDVTCDTTSSLGRWKTTTPYSAIQPYPIQLWQSPPLVIYCGVGLLALTCIFGLIAFSELVSHAWVPNAIFVLYAFICITTFGLLVRVVRSRKVEWVIFPCSIDGHRIAYIKSRRNAAEADNFTAALTARITAAASCS